MGAQMLSKALLPREPMLGRHHQVGGGKMRCMWQEQSAELWRCASLRR